MLTIKNEMKEYIEDNHYINWKDEAIMTKAKQLSQGCKDEISIIKNVYHFVRDEIKHAWDVQDQRVSITASDVMREKVGICWAKSNLLAALLRANGIPSGICYQRLTLKDTPDTGYCLHALNAVYVTSKGVWIRMDARGNKEGVNAQCCLEHEQLAFAIREEYDEIDYKEIFAQPLQETMTLLEQSDNVLSIQCDIIYREYFSTYTT